MKVLAYLSLAIVFSAAAGVAAPKKTLKHKHAKPEVIVPVVEEEGVVESVPVNPSVGESSAAVTSTQLETVASAPSDEKVTGGVELRPGYKSLNGEFISENWIAGGYQFNKDREVGYLQYFNSNLYNPTGATNGLGATIEDGFVKYRMSNLLNNGKGLSLSYEPRAYLPTNSIRRNAGMITTIRNYVRLTQQFNSQVSVSLYEIPMFHVYNRGGYVDAKGNAVANPEFENRVYLVTDVNITEKLSVSLPLLYEAKRNANFSAVAVRNNAWAHNFYVWPEVNYQATPNMAVGVAYYTDNLLGPINGADPTVKAGDHLTASTIGKGFEKGVTQLILRASL